MIVDLIRKPSEEDIIKIAILAKEKYFNVCDGFEDESSRNEAELYLSKLLDMQYEDIVKPLFFKFEILLANNKTKCIIADGCNIRDYLRKNLRKKSDKSKRLFAGWFLIFLHDNGFGFLIRDIVETINEEEKIN